MLADRYLLNLLLPIVMRSILKERISCTSLLCSWDLWVVVVFVLAFLQYKHTLCLNHLETAIKMDQTGDCCKLSPLAIHLIRTFICRRQSIRIYFNWLIWWRRGNNAYYYWYFSQHPGFPEYQVITTTNKRYSDYFCGTTWYSYYYYYLCIHWRL